MAEMKLQQEAVRSLLLRLSEEGREWYRTARFADNDLFKFGASANFTVFDGSAIHEIGRNPAGAFPKGKFLLTKAHPKENAAVVGFWLRWDFLQEPYEFRLFLGLWYRAEGKRIFNGYRFDTPETGEEHDYYHCQPCRNFADKGLLPEAATVSDKFPTIPVNASNIVELTVCGLMAALGRKETKRFLMALMNSGDAGNEFLRSAYLRCVKESSVDFVRQCPDP